MNALTLPDIAAQASRQALPLEWVGMCGIALPILIDGQRLNARADAGVSLDDGEARGIHMSRLYLRLQQALGLDVDVLAFELDLAPLLARPLPRAGALSRFPSVRRDLAFVVPEAVSWAALEAGVRAAAGASLREVRLFDRYVGKGVETGFKSLAMALILQDESRTLTDRDVESVVAAVVAALEHEHAAVIRR